MRRLIGVICSSQVTGIHVSFCQQKSTGFSGRAQESAISLIRIRGYATVPLGWWFLLSAEPDIHLLSETPKSPHKRLSLCSLPVPKQTDGSLWSCLRRPARDLRDLAACAPNDPDVLYSQAGFYAAAVPPSCSAGTKSCFLRSTASMSATIFLHTAPVGLFLFPLCCPRS